MIRRLVGKRIFGFESRGEGSGLQRMKLRNVVGEVIDSGLDGAGEGLAKFGRLGDDSHDVDLGVGHLVEQ